ncbi:c-type cytochrome [Rhizobium lusitanum]|uniref:Cytochrome c n=1 Tax=Rhizobium lusitanum TaxID=293958 RepID=A0A7X0IUB1_9HYPH|nr:cytochrome c family protein [Rhizobium lusitanum]MBB6486868.1 cytochrome c [Rhizobium lusitanum]
MAEDIAHGARVFRLCASCHSVDSETNRFGPFLKGVVGRRAAAVPNYRYSEAMVKAAADGLSWDEKTLAEYLYSPKSKVPGTSMRFGGLWTASEIEDVIAYLRANP